MDSFLKQQQVQLAEVSIKIQFFVIHFCIHYTKIFQPNWNESGGTARQL